MLAAVTGASGHLGANLVRVLIARGQGVRALVHRDTRALEGLELERVEGDILDPPSLIAAFKGADTVFHLAARISVVGHDRSRVEEMNISGVKNVVEACRSAGVKRLVHTSSFHALEQEPLDGVFDESRPLVEGDSYPPYNFSKAEGERIINQAVAGGLDAVIVNPTGIIGPYDFQPSHFGATVLAIAQGKLPALVNAGLDWVDARDVSAGMIAAAEAGRTGRSYILGGHWVSLGEIARQISEITGRKPFCPVLPYGLACAAAPVVSAYDRLRGKRALFTPISIKELDCNRNVSHARAADELGYRPRPFRETIADTLEWFRANGNIEYEKAGSR
jgi:dihydroflavonol-4-reductase